LLYNNVLKLAGLLVTGVGSLLIPLVLCHSLVDPGDELELALRVFQGHVVALLVGTCGVLSDVVARVCPMSDWVLLVYLLGGLERIDTGCA